MCFFINSPCLFMNVSQDNSHFNFIALLPDFLAKHLQYKDIIWEDRTGRTLFINLFKKSIGHRFIHCLFFSYLSKKLLQMLETNCVEVPDFFVKHLQA